MPHGSHDGTRQPCRQGCALLLLPCLHILSYRRARVRWVSSRALLLVPSLSHLLIPTSTSPTIDDDTDTDTDTDHGAREGRRRVREGCGRTRDPTTLRRHFGQHEPEHRRQVSAHTLSPSRCQRSTNQPTAGSPTPWPTSPTMTSCMMSSSSRKKSS